MTPRKNPATARHETRAAESGADGPARQAAFFARMAGGRQFWALFEYLPDVDFFVKDTEGCFVAGNAGLLRRLGLRSEAELIGLRDADIHPPRVAREIREDDAQVIRTRQPLVDRVEALFTRSQAKAWYVTTKLPIVDRRGAVLGVMGFVRPYHRDGTTIAGAERIEAAVAHIQTHHAAQLSVPALARLVHLSERQLNRRFREVFGMSPQAFLLRTRVQAACDALIVTDQSLAEIAQAHGFYDQSAFSRQFSEHTGETPLKFRQRHRSTGSASNQA